MNSLITYATNRKMHDRRYALDEGKMEMNFEWLPETMFDEVSVKTVERYLNNTN